MKKIQLINEGYGMEAAPSGLSLKMTILRSYPIKVGT